MRLSLSSLRRLVREELDLGDVVFSPHRIDGAPVDEPDTAEEARLYRDLAKWIRGEPDSRGTYADLASRLRDLLYSRKHSDFFKSPPPDTVIYRGLHGLTPEAVSRWLSRSGRDAWPELVDGRWHPCRITLRPDRDDMMSWSTSEAVATGTFARNVYDEPGHVSVVFRAVVAGARDAVDIDAIQGAVEGLYGELSEGEVLTLGPVVVDGVRRVS